jgi:hypothetical protein
MQCDEICRREERNKRLQEALVTEAASLVSMGVLTATSCDAPGVANPDGTVIFDREEPLHPTATGVAVPREWPRDVVEAALAANRHPSKLETELRAFVIDPARVTLYFRPTNRMNRRFERLMSVALGLDAESIDEEPMRSVLVRKHPSYNPLLW